MNDNTSNKLDMAKACITLVEKPESIIIWQGQPPLDFAADFARMKQTYTGLRGLAIAADTDNSGDADAKSDAEDALEALALQLAAALRNHFKKTGNTSDRAKVTFPKRALVRLRDQILITRCTEIRDLAMQARDESGAQGRGVTQAKITALTAAIALFDDLQRKPRTSIGSSATKRRELVTGVADLIEQLADLDDLVAQLEPTAPSAPSVTGRSPEAVAAFIADWKRQRKVIDAGHGPTEEDQQPTPPTTVEATPRAAKNPTNTEVIHFHFIACPQFPRPAQALRQRRSARIASAPQPPTPVRALTVPGGAEAKKFIAVSLLFLFSRLKSRQEPREVPPLIYLNHQYENHQTPPQHHNSRGGTLRRNRRRALYQRRHGLIHR